MTSNNVFLLPDGPQKKFSLIKIYGPWLRYLGHDPKTMSCAELVMQIMLAPPPPGKGA